MKKLSVLVLIFLTSLISSQQLTDTGKGYSEVIEVGLKKDVIYQKLKEWISLTYKSANDVVQLDTKTKLITKGNTVFDYVSGEYNVKYRISITMVFAIKDNKYKIDFNPTEIKADIIPDVVIDKGVYELLMSNNVLSKKNYLISAKEIALNQYRLLGFSEKKSNKMIKKVDKYLVEGYDSYKLNKASFDKEIESLYTSIKNAVNKKEDW